MRNEIIATVMAGACAMMAFSNAASADEFDRGAELLAEIQQELRVDRVASKQDRRMNKMRAAISVRWDINADFEVTSGPKWDIKVNNNGLWEAYNEIVQ